MRILCLALLLAACGATDSDLCRRSCALSYDGLCDARLTSSASLDDCESNCGAIEIADADYYEQHLACRESASTCAERYQCGLGPEVGLR